jgi:hypothetical protein
MIYNILNLLLLLGFCLFCSVLVFVINFVLGFAVQLASISTKLPSSVASVGNWFHQRRQFTACLFFTSITHLATLDVIGFVLGLQSNFRPALQSAARLALQSTYRLIASRRYLLRLRLLSSNSSLHGSFLGGKHLALTSLIAYTTALHCVWFLPFHTRGGSDRSPGAGHRSGRLPQGALPVSGMPWGSNDRILRIRTHRLTCPLLLDVNEPLRASHGLWGMHVVSRCDMW